MDSILVTGANGYIGRHVVAALKKQGAFVIAVDRSQSQNSLADISIEADLFRSQATILDELDIVPDACMHLAWRNGFNHMDSSHMQDLSSHFDFLTGIAERGVQRIAVMGSMHEIGYWEGAIDESTPCEPQSLYGVAKNALRQALELQFSNSAIALQWIRGFYIYGDDEKSQSIFGKLIRAAQSGQETFPFTSGSNKYDFLHIDELAAQIASVVMQDKINGIINCCSGNPITLAEMVESFITSNNLDISLEYGAFPDRPYDSPGIWGDSTKIEMIMHNSSNA